MSLRKIFRAGRIQKRRPGGRPEGFFPGARSVFDLCSFPFVDQVDKRKQAKRVPAQNVVFILRGNMRVIDPRPLAGRKIAAVVSSEKNLFRPDPFYGVFDKRLRQ